MTPIYLKRYRDSLPKKPPTCHRAKILRKMPPLQHRPDWCPDFLISNSEPVRFIMLVLGGSPDSPKDWSAAVQLFQEARKNRVIVYNPATRMWRGCEYKPGSESPEIRSLVRRTHYCSPKRNQQQDCAASNPQPNNHTKPFDGLAGKRPPSPCYDESDVFAAQVIDYLKRNMSDAEMKKLFPDVGDD